jgi:hypothetical protein
MGTIKANVKKMITDGTMEIEMSQAVAGIKGTRFILTATPEESILEVTEGTVAFRSKANGAEVMVGAGESIHATAGGLSEKTTFDAERADAALIEETSGTTLADPDYSQGSSGKQFLLLGMLGAIVVAGVFFMYRYTRSRKESVQI